MAQAAPLGLDYEIAYWLVQHINGKEPVVIECRALAEAMTALVREWDRGHQVYNVEVMGLVGTIIRETRRIFDVEGDNQARSEQETACTGAAGTDAVSAVPDRGA